MIEARTLIRTGKPVYDVRLRDPNGHEYCRTFPTKKKAEAFQDSERTDMRRGVWVDQRLASRSFEIVAMEWLISDLGKRSKSLLRDEGIVNKHLLPVIGKKQIGSITRGDVQKARQRLVHLTCAPLRSSHARRGACHRDLRRHPRPRPVPESCHRSRRSTARSSTWRT
jgi:hypothetical protein